jgi:hypothetical protein
MPCHETSRDGLSANDYLPHGQILQTGSDTSPKWHSSRQSSSNGLLEFHFGEIKG